jgi:2-oxoglutarate dehydrogenase E1 component
VVLTPKSLLRHPRAGSSLDELSTGRFQPVLDDSTVLDRHAEVERLILCSGKIAVDLAGAREAESELDQMASRVAIARIEQLYPLPVAEIETVIARYPRLRQIVWLQEEPRNMGAWGYMAPRLRPLLPERVSFAYVGRPERASTAEGLADAHAAEQARIAQAAFARP